MTRVRPHGGPERLFPVLVAVLLALAGCSRASGRIGPTPLKNLPNTPVLLVHGYNPRSCPGADVTHAQWGGVYLELTRGGWRAPILPVSYYACDHDGVDITGYGPTTPAGATSSISPGTPRVHYDQNTSIDEIAHDLGWFVYDTFGRSGTPVDLVGSSMGGLVIRDLLYRVAQGDSRFPPRLAVEHAVTFSTPFRGYGRGTSLACPVATFQCQQFAVGSPLLATLNADPQPPQGDGGTTWAVVGSSAGCDFVPAASSLGVSGVERVDYLTPCYGHVAYLWDFDPDSNAAVRISRPDGSTISSKTAQHSLSWLLTTLAGK
jgi:pimeloyl-ACP methyl ester carboxylesterase